MKTLRVNFCAIACVSILTAVGFSSCSKEEITAPATKETASISVDFGDGEDVWSASYSEWVDYRNKYNEVNIYLESPTQFPAVIGSVNPEGTTLFPDSWDVNGFLFFEYYSERWPLVGSAIKDYENDVNYGDWQVESGEVTITSINATMLSGKAELVMYDLYDVVANDSETPATKSLTVTFTDIPIYTIAQYGAATRGISAGTSRTFKLKGGLRPSPRIF